MSQKNKLFEELKLKIESKTCLVGILGSGYVGFNLGSVIAKEGFNVLGFDLMPERIKNIEEKNIPHFHATEDFAKLPTADIIIVTVPTILHENKHPNLQPLHDAAFLIQKHLRPGQLIIFESTVAPGMTKTDFVAIICQNHTLKPDVDFFVGYSPERVDPGNANYNIHNTPKIVSGWGSFSTTLTKMFYQRVIEHVVEVSSIEVAEFAKMLENIVRFVTINLINELEEYAVKKGINLWEVIEAAATKPFGYFPVFPSPGIGGHCIPVNLYYLLEDAKKNGITCDILQHAAAFHEKRIKHIVDLGFEILKKQKKTKNPKICILGMSIKPGSDNIAESVGLKMLRLIEEKRGIGSYHDPFVPKISKYHNEPFSDDFLQQQDLFIIVTDHKEIDFSKLLSYKKPIIDTKNVYKDKKDFIYKV